MQRNIDPLDLIQQANRLLSIHKENSSFPLEETEANNLIRGQEQLLIEKNPSSYFSVFVLHDKVQKAQYPLFFFPAAYTSLSGQTFLKRKNNVVFFNPMLNNVLKNINTDIFGIGREDDLVSYKLSLESTIALKDKESRYAIEPILSFHSEEEILFATTYNDLANLLIPTNRPSCLQGLFSKVKIPDDNSTILENNQDFLHQEYQRLLYRLKQTGSCKITYLDIPNVVSLAKFSLLHLAKQGENVAIIASDEDAEIIQKYLDTPVLQPLVFDLSRTDLGDEIPQDCHLKSIPKYSCQKADDFEKKRTGFAKLEEKKQTCFRLLKETIAKIPQSFLSAALSRDRKTFAIDIEDYTSEDFQNDFAFLKTFSSFSFLPTLKRDHVHYQGLTSNGSQESFEKLDFLLRRILKELHSFKARIQQDNMRSFSGTPIQSFQAFQEFGKSLRLLGGYNGFPKKYFDITKDSTDLENLKLLYQRLSSSKLLIENLLDKGFKTIDLKKLLEDYDSHSPIRKWQSQKSIQSHIRDKTARTDVKTIVRLLRTYSDCFEELESKKSLYAKIYGDNVLTMNGTIELETNIKYVSEFHLRSTQDPGFNLQSPLVKKCFKDKAFFLKLLSHYQDIEKDFIQLRNDINLYIGFFLDDKKNYLSLSFDDLIALFTLRQEGTYEEFHEYALFRNGEQTCSTPLRLCLRREIANANSLEDFPFTFVLSLLISIYNHEQQEFQTFRKDYIASKKSFLEDIKKNNVFLDERLRKAFVEGQSKILSSSFFQDSLQRLRVTYQKEDLSCFQEMVRLLSHIRPVFLCRENDLKKIAKQSFDVVLLFNSHRFTDIGLVKSLLIGKQAFLLNDNAINDERTLGYKETRLDKSTLYYNHFDFEIDKEIFLRLQSSFDALGYMMNRSEVFPLVLQQKGQGTDSALLLNLFARPGTEKENQIDLREYLHLTHNMDLVDIDVVHFLINAEEAMKDSLLED